MSRWAIKLTEEQIMQEALKNNGFGLSWHWRVDGCRDRCRKLVRLGLLYVKRSNRGSDEWGLTNKVKKNGLPKANAGFYPRKRELLEFPPTKTDKQEDYKE